MPVELPDIPGRVGGEQLLHSDHSVQCQHQHIVLPCDAMRIKAMAAMSLMHLWDHALLLLLVLQVLGALT
jgi:hypothetical protein